MHPIVEGFQTVGPWDIIQYRRNTMWVGVGGSRTLASTNSTRVTEFVPSIGPIEGLPECSLKTSLGGGGPNLPAHRIGTDSIATSIVGTRVLTA